MAIEVTRMLMLAGQQPGCSRVTVRVNDEVSSYLNNKKRKEIIALEEEAKMTILIHGSETLFPEHLEIDCRDAAGNQIALLH